MRKIKITDDDDEVFDMVIGKLILADLPPEKEVKEPLQAYEMAFHAGSRIAELVKGSCAKLKTSQQLAALDKAMKAHRANPGAGLAAAAAKWIATNDE